MTYAVQNGPIGIQPIEATSTVQQHTLGFRVRAVDPVYGAADFIYLQGVASTVAGSVVTYGEASTGTGVAAHSTWLTALAPATANLAQPVAVSMSANVANQFGWYQISGVGVVATNGTISGAGAQLYLAGSGQLTTTAAAGKQVVGARTASANGVPTGNFCLAVIEEPFAQGAIT